jgi:hypothetical protein
MAQDVKMEPFVCVQLWDHDVLLGFGKECLNGLCAPNLADELHALSWLDWIRECESYETREVRCSRDIA